MTMSLLPCHARSDVVALYPNLHHVIICLVSRVPTKTSNDSLPPSSILHLTTSSINNNRSLSTSWYRTSHANRLWQLLLLHISSAWPGGLRRREEATGLVVVKEFSLLCRGGAFSALRLILDSRSIICSLVHFVWVQKFVVLKKIFPVIAIRFDFPSFMRTEKTQRRNILILQRSQSSSPSPSSL
jgi:hypothetical protein